MHCPRCGQQQISNETKFCSRCGFQMGLVSELLANNGYLPQLAELYARRSTWFTRKNGVIFTALWFIFWTMMLPAFFGLAGAEEVAGASAVFGIFSSIMLLVISLGILKKAPKTYQVPMLEVQAATPNALHGSVPNHALPPHQGQPVTAYTAPQGSWRTPDTGEFANPGSVTDNTTKLLQKEQDQ